MSTTDEGLLRWIKSFHIHRVICQTRFLAQQLDSVAAGATATFLPPALFNSVRQEKIIDPLPTDVTFLGQHYNDAGDE